jgi:hypothetical protein
MLRQYLKVRQSLLFEMMRLEAPPHDRICTNCQTARGTYRCKDCFPRNFHCAMCCISAHSTQPFHRIQKFGDGCFEHSDLDNLGFLLDIRPHTDDCSLNHFPDDGIHTGSTSDDEEWQDDGGLEDETTKSFKFRQQHSDVDKIVVIASTGILKRSVKWCRCPNAPDKYIQLLRSSLFPATFTNPKTVFTFEVLDHFRLDALECNTSALNFMSKLTRRTNEIFPETVPVGINNQSPFHPTG